MVDHTVLLASEAAVRHMNKVVALIWPFVVKALILFYRTFIRYVAGSDMCRLPFVAQGAAYLHGLVL